RPCWTETLFELTRMYAGRYKPIPIMITETAGRGTIKKRIAWIDDSVETVRKARAEGMAVIGYTFWPLFSLCTWAYQRGGNDIAEYKLDMGLYDLKQGPSGWERVPTPVVDAFRRVVAQGIDRRANV